MLDVTLVRKILTIVYHLYINDEMYSDHYGKTSVACQSFCPKIVT